MKTAKQILEQFHLEGKISTQHAKDIEEVLDCCLKEIRIDSSIETFNLIKKSMDKQYEKTKNK